MIKYLILILPIFVFSQEAIRVEYEAKQEFDKAGKEKLGAKFTEMWQNSESKRYYYELFTNTEQSRFSQIVKINNEQNVKGISLGLLTDVSSNIYKNFKANELYEQSEMMPKTLVKDSIQVFPWVLTKEEATILGYKVKKATYTNKNQTVEAWYTTELAFRNGPSRFGGLPGFILKVSFKLPFSTDLDTNVSFTAIDIKPYKGKIELPTKLRIVTKDIYDKELDKITSKFSEVPSGVEKD